MLRKIRKVCIVSRNFTCVLNQSPSPCIFGNTSNYCVTLILKQILITLCFTPMWGGGRLKAVMYVERPRNTALGENQVLACQEQHRRVKTGSDISYTWTREVFPS